jgi:antitoxin VapB
MSTRLPTSPSPAIASVFTSGNSQAIRLPKEFRFDTKQVTIERRGDEIVLRAKPKTLGDLLKDLPPLTEEEAVAFDQAMAQAKDTRPPEVRTWFNEQAVETPKTKLRPPRQTKERK